MPEPSGLSIGEVSQRLGVPVPTLRSWHLRYGIALPARTTGGHRRYSPEELQVLQALAAAVARGVGPRAAARALRRPGPDPEVPVSLLSGLLQAAQDRDQDAFLAALDHAADNQGLEATVDQTLLPALHEIGRRWEVQLLDVGAEHLATAAARTWVARQRATAAPPADAGLVLLAAGPGNEHTVALEAFGMLLSRRGWRTRELGANTPVESVLRALPADGVRSAVVTAHQATRRRGAVEALHAIQARGDVPLFYAGAAFDTPGRRRDVPGTYLGTQLPGAADVVERSLLSQQPAPADRRPVAVGTSPG